MDKVALRVVPLAARQDLAAVLLGLLNDAGDLVKGGAANDGALEVLELGARADSDRLGLLGEALLETAFPERFGNVGAGESRALLARVLEGGADGLDDAGLDVGRGVVQVEVLAAYLSAAVGRITPSLPGYILSCRLFVPVLQTLTASEGVERTGLADDPGVATVNIQTLRNVLPQTPEDVG